MLAGALYRPADPDLVAARLRCVRLVRAYNAGDPADEARRAELLAELLGAAGPGCAVMPPFACDYGWNIRLGRNAFLNYGCVLLDPAPIEIGDDAKLGPAVQIYTAGHPLEAELRRSGVEWAKPVRIGRDAWIGGGSVILPGVTIGEGAVVGAGSVVTRDVPAGAVVAGNPARPIAASDRAGTAG